MDSLTIAQRYFDAWNRRDPAGVVDTFAEGGIYNDPSSGGVLTGEAIGQYAGGLFAAFPDLYFDIVSAAPAGDGVVAAQWVMKGTNSGPVMGLPPTGKAIALPGADFISIDGDRVRSVQGYFDQKTFVEQLGLQSLVQPYSMGPISFGRAVHINLGKTTKPGAFSLTVLTVRSNEERERISEYARKILQGIAQVPGFISGVTAYAGNRMFTMSAWEDPESPRQILRQGAHKEAADAFFGPDFIAGGITGVWVPHRINASWIRCESCGQMVNYDKFEGKCQQCGQPLPERLPYWGLGTGG